MAEQVECPKCQSNDTTGALHEAFNIFKKGWYKRCINCGHQWFIEFKTTIKGK